MQCRCQRAGILNVEHRNCTLSTVTGTNGTLSLDPMHPTDEQIIRAHHARYHALISQMSFVAPLPAHFCIELCLFLGL